MPDEAKVKKVARKSRSLVKLVKQECEELGERIEQNPYGFFRTSIASTIRFTSMAGTVVAEIGHLCLKRNPEWLSAMDELRKQLAPYCHAMFLTDTSRSPASKLPKIWKRTPLTYNRNSGNRIAFYATRGKKTDEARTDYSGLPRVYCCCGASFDVEYRNTAIKVSLGARKPNKRSVKLMNIPRSPIKGMKLWYETND